ncbi:S9 family peptidase [Saccharicrinis fermentans]|uniref:Prolyl tripeptidyl peptidase n=1 Tax=Saccharicrinis fermentans DSM 9555 = JCM 21142 TaxID=869213 RepID=W7Y0X6_9BACT|nr:S9 family peptidase [Saccharicrinis fermentans]GAF04580.1 prolyl tripeptidyl peptidase precursor [Saccharicrinis fermentans DSM 9555 = JCM 21142]
MKLIHVTLMLLIILCACNSPQSSTESGFTNKGIKLYSDKLTPELIWQLGRVGNVSLSPDKEEVLYTVAYTNIKENKSYTDIYKITLKSGKTTQLTNSAINETSVKFSPDGSKINFLSSESGSVQLWEMDLNASHKKQVTNIKGGITNYLYSPDMKHLAFTASVPLDKDIHDLYPDLPLADARIENDLMYRHWDSWEDGAYSHIFIAATEEGMISNNYIDIMKNERFDSPLNPFGGIEQINWSIDSKKIAYSCKKLSGKDYALSTNADIYLYNIEDNSTTNLTKGMVGYDLNPTFSPDGKYMAWESMERDGYEADKNRLFLLDLRSGKKKDLTLDFDQNVGTLSWSEESDKIWFTSNHEGPFQIYQVDLSSGLINQITKGRQNYTSVMPMQHQVIATKTTMNHPTEIYSINTQTGEEQELSFVNKEVLSQLKMGQVESRWIETTDKKQMQTWIIYPPDFDANKKYPTLLYCQGGPQSTISQFWSLRWNFQLMAAQGYIVVAPNRHGLPGFGQEWNEQISGDYGGQNMKDYLTAIDVMAKEPYVDQDRLGAIGASYGGFSVYWLAGNHNKRFKAFVAHCGIFNFEQMYSTTEEMFFVNFDMKGPYWEKDNKIAQNTYANSPHKFVANWDTPILVIHGQKDFRIPYTQGMGAYNTAKLRDIPARFLYFPEESHWVLSPQNGILWHREFFRWLDTYLK